MGHTGHQNYSVDVVGEPMSFDPYGFEAEEARAAERFYTGPDDPDRPDPSEYEERSDTGPEDEPWGPGDPVVEAMDWGDDD